MAKSNAMLFVGLAATAAAVALVWWGAPLAVGMRAPGGLLGMILGLGVVVSFLSARAGRPAAVEEERPA